MGLTLVALGFVSCLGPGHAEGPLVLAPPREAHAQPASLTVVLALDGVRWQEVFEGTDPVRAARAGLSAMTETELMPHLHDLIEHHGCAIGAPNQGVINASGPNFVSLPGYTEIFTGAGPSDCSNNACGRVRKATIVDDALRLQVDTESVAVFSSWSKIGLVATRTPGRVVMSTGRALGSNQGVFRRQQSVWNAFQRGREADPAPGWGDFRPDRHTAELALSYLDSFSPTFVFVGLGETDEYAHHNRYGKYVEALRSADQFIGQLTGRLLEAEQRGVSTLLLVTSDHGRQGFVQHGAEYPESARTWLVAAGSRVRARGRVTSPGVRRLADLAPTIRWVWGLSPGPQESLSDVAAGRVLTELFDAESEG